jgi:hypothetical protein
VLESLLSTRTEPGRSDRRHVRAREPRAANEDAVDAQRLLLAHYTAGERGA